MKITYLGHSCFRIQSKGCTLIIDPYKNKKVPGLADLKESANIILCSHGHDDHNASEIITALPQEKTPFDVSYVTTYHDEVNGQKRGETKLYSIVAEGIRILHMGDIGCPLTEEQIEKFSGYDILMIPVGGFYTIDGSQAAEIVRQLTPKSVIPMHYRKDCVGFDEIATVDQFLSSFADGDILHISSEYTVTDAFSPVTVMTPLYKI